MSLVYGANKLCHNEQKSQTELELVSWLPMLILGNSWIQLLTRNPDKGRRVTMTINLCV
jgi:hypothetical protein